MKAIKAKLIFTRFEFDQGTSWTAVKSVEVTLPDWVKEKFEGFEWHLVGMETTEDQPK